MFFQANSGRYFPISQIQEIRFDRQEGAERLFTVELGEFNATISEGERRRLIEGPLTFVSASQGVQLVDGSNPDDPMFEDVVAWAISPRGEVSPVTPSGINAGTVNPWAVIHASGQVEEPGAVTHED